MKKICLACLLCALPLAAPAQQVTGGSPTSFPSVTRAPAPARVPVAANPGTGGGAQAAAEQAGVKTKATGFFPLLGGLGALGGVAAAGVVAVAAAGGGGGATPNTQ